MRFREFFNKINSTFFLFNPCNLEIKIVISEKNCLVFTIFETKKSQKSVIFLAINSQFEENYFVLTIFFPSNFVKFCREIKTFNRNTNYRKSVVRKSFCFIFFKTRQIAPATLCLPKLPVKLTTFLTKSHFL